MASLNIAEKRLPQDGSHHPEDRGASSVDIRVSTIPTSRGFERIVMRHPAQGQRAAGPRPIWASLAREYALMDEPDQRRPNGIILVTGPTGSGKTTTLYALFEQASTSPSATSSPPKTRWSTRSAASTRWHVQPEHRPDVRQRPTRLLCAKIPTSSWSVRFVTRETAEIAIHASMTGHLVLSTIHTNDAAGAVTRLVEMDIEPFLVRSTVIGILAQRLVRVLCDGCKEPYTATPLELEQLGIDPERTRRRDTRVLSSRYVVPGATYEPIGWRGEGMPTFHRPTGCDKCLKTGFAGRIGIYELMVADDTVGNLILKSADAQTIKRAAQEQGMDSLRDDGARKVLEGRTTVQEVVAATQEDVFVDSLPPSVP